MAERGRHGFLPLGAHHASGGGIPQPRFRGVSLHPAKRPLHGEVVRDDDAPVPADQRHQRHGFRCRKREIAARAVGDAPVPAPLPQPRAVRHVPGQNGLERVRTHGPFQPEFRRAPARPGARAPVFGVVLRVVARRVRSRRCPGRARRPRRWRRPSGEVHPLATLAHAVRVVRRPHRIPRPRAAPRSLFQPCVRRRDRHRPCPARRARRSPSPVASARVQAPGSAPWARPPDASSVAKRSGPAACRPGALRIRLRPRPFRGSSVRRTLRKRPRQESLRHLRPLHVPELDARDGMRTGEFQVTVQGSAAA